jgi:ribose/xylose/arabinose/galactoside ABC-type transport system permease subunit
MLVLQAVLSLTGWGRALFVVGASAETARLAGLPVDRIRITAYALSGALAAFAGIVIVGFYAQTSTGMGTPYLLGSSRLWWWAGASILAAGGPWSARSAARWCSAKWPPWSRSRTWASTSSS